MKHTKDFIALVDEVSGDIKHFFLHKNAQYAQEEDILKAFRDGALRKYGVATPSTMLDVLISYTDKHILALLEHGADLPDVRDRLKDIIVYALLAMLIVTDDE